MMPARIKNRPIHPLMISTNCGHHLKIVKTPKTRNPRPKTTLIMVDKSFLPSVFFVSSAISSTSSICPHFLTGLQIDPGEAGTV